MCITRSIEHLCPRYEDFINKHVARGVVTDDSDANDKTTHDGQFAIYSLFSIFGTNEPKIGKEKI